MNTKGQWQSFRRDLDAYVGTSAENGGKIRKFKRILSCAYKHPALLAVASYRLGRSIRLSRTPGLRQLLLLFYYFFIYIWVRLLIGVEIPLSCDLAPGLTVWHYGGIIFGGGVVAGHNLSIGAGVMIGRKRHNGPIAKLGNNVSVSAHSVVLCEYVGDNVIIGAGSIVTRDIPSNSLVAGNPARVIRQLSEPDPLIDPSHD